MRSGYWLPILVPSFSLFLFRLLSSFIEKVRGMFVTNSLTTNHSKLMAGVTWASAWVVHGNDVHTMSHVENSVAEASMIVAEAELAFSTSHFSVLLYRCTLTITSDSPNRRWRDGNGGLIRGFDRDASPIEGINDMLQIPQIDPLPKKRVGPYNRSSGLRRWRLFRNQLPQRRRPLSTRQRNLIRWLPDRCEASTSVQEDSSPLSRIYPVLSDLLTSFLSRNRQRSSPSGRSTISFTQSLAERSCGTSKDIIGKPIWALSSHVWLLQGRIVSLRRTHHTERSHWESGVSRGEYHSKTMFWTRLQTNTNW